jgi:hypothetical protein
MKNNNTTHLPLFMPDDDWHLNAKLHFCHGFDMFAEGYKKAADILVANIKVNDGLDVDYLVYPIAFLYRHHLELRLKHIINEGIQLLAKSDGFPEHHNLGGLWETAKQIINEVFQHEPSADEEFQHIDHIVGELCITDPKSDSFRYPVFKKGGKIKGGKTLSGLNLINVRHLAEEIEKAYEFLYNVSAYIEEANDFHE